MSVEVATNALISITILLVIGLFMAAIGKKIQISNLFLLLLSGITLSFLNRINAINLFFSDVLLVSLAVITLVMVVFEGTSSFNIRRLESISIPALKLVGYFLLLGLIFIAPIVSLMFFDNLNLSSLLFGAVVAVIMAGTDPSSVFSMLKTGSNKVVELLELESIFNTPFTIILPLIFIEIIQSSSSSTRLISAIVFAQLKPLLLEISAGVGLGLILGYIVSKNFKKFYTSSMAPIALLTFALGAYLVSELIGGSGVLAVATMGLMFGSYVAKDSDGLHSFNETLSNLFLLLVFILAGFIIDTSVSLFFVFKILFLVIVGMMTRYIAIDFVLRHKDFTIKEKFFMSMMMPKGVAVAVVALSLAVMTFVPVVNAMLAITVQIILLSMVMSLFFSTIVAHFSPTLLNRGSSENVVGRVASIKKKTPLKILTNNSFLTKKSTTKKTKPSSKASPKKKVSSKKQSSRKKK